MTLEDLEARETILIMYVKDKGKWCVDDFDSLEVTSYTWPRGETESRYADDPVRLGTAMVGPDGDKWSSRCRTPSGHVVKVSGEATRDDAIAVLRNAINKVEEA